MAAPHRASERLPCHPATHTPSHSELQLKPSDCTHRDISSVCSEHSMQELQFWTAVQGKPEGSTGNICQNGKGRRTGARTLGRHRNRDTHRPEVLRGF